jgi:hypothetical protein
MKSVTLRTLLREPGKVKRWTRTGARVQVTDNGVALWILHPADAPGNEQARRCAVEEVLAEVLRERPSTVSAARLLEASRR